MQSMRSTVEWGPTACVDPSLHLGQLRKPKGNMWDFKSRLGKPTNRSRKYKHVVFCDQSLRMLSVPPHSTPAWHQAVALSGYRQAGWTWVTGLPPGSGDRRDPVGYGAKKLWPLWFGSKLNDSPLPMCLWRFAGGTYCGWTKSISHHLETMGNHGWLVFTGESAFHGVLGGAGFRPSTVCFPEDKDSRSDPLAFKQAVPPTNNPTRKIEGFAQHTRMAG